MLISCAAWLAHGPKTGLVLHALSITAPFLLRCGHEACPYHAGIGKSTLLGLISGQLEPTRGTVTRNPKVGLASVCASSLHQLLSFCVRRVSLALHCCLPVVPMAASPPELVAMGSCAMPHHHEDLPQAA